MELCAARLGALAALIAPHYADILPVADVALAEEALEFADLERLALGDADTMPSASQVGLTKRTDFLAIPDTGIPQLHSAVLGAGGSVLAASEGAEK